MRNNYMYSNSDYSQNHMKNPNGQWNGPVPNVAGYMNPDFGHAMIPGPFMEAPPMMNEAYPPNSKLNQYVSGGGAWDDTNTGKVDADDVNGPSFTFNKGAANVPMHLSGTDGGFENEFKRNSGWHNKNRNVQMNIPPPTDNWNVGNSGIDHHNVQGNWPRPMNVPMGGNHMNNVPIQGGWDNMKRQQNAGNYRGNKNSYIDNNMKQNMHHGYIPRNDINFPRNNMNSGFNNTPNMLWNQNNNLNSQYINPRIPIGHHHEIPLPRQNTNQNINPPHVNVGGNQLPVQGGNRNISNQHENRNKHDSTSSMVLGNTTNHSNIQTPTENPGNVFSNAEDSYWRDPNGEMKKWQRDTGTAAWGDPEENNNSTIKRWMIPSIPDLLEGDHMISGIEKENGVKIVIARGWGDENHSGMNSPQIKSNTSVASPLYNKNENRWSPDSGKGNRLGIYGSGDGSDWEADKNAHPFSGLVKGANDMVSRDDHLQNTPPSPDLIKLALSKKYIDNSMLNRQGDPQYTKQLNLLLGYVQQASFLENQLDNFRRANENSFAANDNPEIQNEAKKNHNALIVEVARVKNEIVSLRDMLKNRLSGMPSPSNCELPPGSLLHSIKSDYNFTTTNDDFLHDTLTTTNAGYGMDSASAAVNRALANLDISGSDNQSGNILASTVWNIN
uniref:Protein Gawky n=1 Tax=Strongyloides papillosus TaxID=174720 RepID=A0A0N5BIS9_STREA